MSSCSDIQERAAYLAALAENDPELQEARAHALDCATCRDRLAAATRTLSLLSALPLPPPPSAEVLRRAAAPILAELAAPPALTWSAARRAGAYTGAIVLSWGLSAALAKHRAPDLESWLLSSAMLVAALVAALQLLSRGTAAAVSAVVLSGLFAGLVGRGGPLAPSIGVHCFMIELAAAILPLGLTAYLVRTKRSVTDGWRAAAAGALGALAGQAGLHLTCPMHRIGLHLIIFHTGGVLAATLLGVVVQASFRAPAPTPPRS